MENLELVGPMRTDFSQEPGVLKYANSGLHAQLIYF
jgi:hypothetical protein